MALVGARLLLIKQKHLGSDHLPDYITNFTAYLKENLSSGEQVELWSLWIGNESIPPARYAGHLKDFDMDTLHQFLDAESICITITV